MHACMSVLKTCITTPVQMLHFASVVLKGSKVASGVVAALQDAGLLGGIPDFYALNEVRTQNVLLDIYAFTCCCTPTH